MTERQRFTSADYEMAAKGEVVAVDGDDMRRKLKAMDLQAAAQARVIEKLRENLHGRAKLCETLLVDADLAKGVSAIGYELEHDKNMLELLDRLEREEGVAP